MAIIHGSWLMQNQGGSLFVWGETWRSSLATSDYSLTDVPTYPLAMAADELVEWLQTYCLPIAKSLPLSARASVPSEHTHKDGDAPHTSLVHSQIITLPTYVPNSSEAGTAPMYPVHSATLGSETHSSYLLQPWQVEGLRLDPLETMKFLTSLPLGVEESAADTFLGGDLRFWSQVARWSLDLLSRCKFLPTINRQSNSSIITEWRALQESAVDQSRLEKI